MLAGRDDLEQRRTRPCQSGTGRRTRRARSREDSHAGTVRRGSADQARARRHHARGSSAVRRADRRPGFQPPPPRPVPASSEESAMEADRFDDLARRVASSSRRQLLGGLLTGLGATFGIHDAGAQEKERDSEQDDAQLDPAQATAQDPAQEQPKAKSKDSPTEQDTGSVVSPDTERHPPPDQQQRTHDQSKDTQQDKQQDHPHDKRQEKQQAREQTQEKSAKQDDSDKPQAKSEHPDKKQH